MKKGIVCLLILFISLAACSDSPPEIMQISWQVMLFNDRESGFSYQKLSLFVNIEDEDGIKDIGALYLIHEAKELFWSLDESNWEMTEKGNATWIGSNAFTMPSAEPFPTGKYRVYLEDLSGQSDETFIYISNDNINTEQVTFPDAYLDGDKIYIKGTYENYELWVYDENNRFVAAFPVDKNGIKTEVITTRDSSLNNNFIYYAYAVHEKKVFGILNGPYYFRTPLSDTK
jgi:hypothetical protein